MLEYVAPTYSLIRVVLPLGSRGDDEMGGKCPSKWVWSLSIFHIFLYGTLRNFLVLYLSPFNLCVLVPRC